MKNFQFLYQLEKGYFLQSVKLNHKNIENNFYFYNNFVCDTRSINYKYFDYTIDSGKFIFKKSFFNDKFSSYFFKKAFSIVSEIIFKGLRFLVIAKNDFSKESTYFYKYVFGLKSYSKNDYIFNRVYSKSNSFFWKKKIFSFSVKNRVGGYILADNTFTNNLLGLLNSTRRVVIAFVSPGYYNEALSYFMFIEISGYIVRYLFISYVYSVYYLYLLNKNHILKTIFFKKITLKQKL